jgi:arylsulfatase A-like enzyme
LHENYANSVHLADRSLGEFFRQLQARPYLANSLIVLVGDHSFPTTDRGYPNYALDDFSEEGARTVLLILWRPERLSPRRIGHSAHSQVDIAPSLLDLLHLNVPNHFIGTSIFDPAPEMQSTIFVIQPFGGQYVSVIEPPIKYVMHLESGMEFLFDLDIDPDQKNNLIWRMRETGVAEHFRKELQKVYLNQRLIEDDRIWPQ